MNTNSIAQMPVNHGSDRDHIRRTEAATYARIVQASEARSKRTEAMLAKTAAESPWAAGDILWAV